MNLLRPALLLAVTLLCSRPASGEEAKPAAPASASSYLLQKKSTFTGASAESRAPFWPIGWVKRKAGQPMQTAAAAAAPAPAPLEEQNFKVSSILLGAPSMAIINGRTYTEGELLRQPRSGSTRSAAPRIRVYRIKDGQVLLQCDTQLLTLNLARPELTAKRQEAELLSEDRP